MVEFCIEIYLMGILLVLIQIIFGLKTIVFLYECMLFVLPAAWDVIRPL